MPSSKIQSTMPRAPARDTPDRVPAKSATAAKWREDNRAALESSNAYVEAHGLPLARYRLN